MKLIKWFPALLIIALCALFFVGKLLLSYWHSPLQHLTESQLYTVESGKGFNAVANDLSAQGILQRPLLTALWVRFFEPEFLLKEGEYRFPEFSSPSEIIEILDSGVSVQYKVTLLEGENIWQTLSRLPASDTLNNDLVKLDTPTTDAHVNQLLTARAIELMDGAAQAEGWFLPDTYFYSRGDLASSILLRAHLAMIDLLDEEWSARDQGLPYRSAYEALIMASLIEKETGVAYERRQIAGVFVRRLQKRMRLQTDPSVIYGLGAEYKGDLRRVHLKRDTVYNTYTRHGLPPTPIAMPGRAAIHAALHPLEGDALYFVAKGDGSHYFSATLKEHQAAVRKYQIKQRRADYRSAPAPLKSDAG